MNFIIFLLGLFIGLYIQQFINSWIQSTSLKMLENPDVIKKIFEKIETKPDIKISKFQQRVHDMEKKQKID